MYRFEKLIAWQKAVDLTEDVYRASKDFPDDERFGLTSQLRRASTSIVLNLAEGSAAEGRKEFIYFCGVARKSQYEVAAALRIAQRLNYLKGDTFQDLDARTAEVGRLIAGLIGSLRNANGDSIREDSMPLWDDDLLTEDDMSWWSNLISEPNNNN